MGTVMALPTSEPTVGETVSIEVECTDCGHTRWLRTENLWTFGVAPHVPLTRLAGRLFCSACRTDGLPGKSVTVMAAFATDKARLKAERWQAAKTLEAPGSVLRARSI